ncbi:ATP synthase subunit delta, sodium ion specific [Clostridium acetireducens DSM 10703]|uniref:ATP synthase subunit delta n=1 Tax=Clostridium acetireducens DSM 10703 TaxID=1121290 RepID=A0A1E8EVY9_9CLOT|nr:F0F1 ATP synthase subunit delta [Clostridium acetireducens]OFI01400.1 ATP synthase subunit delta, sodium ion specific [Clostridium acetireducens DSM 10703]
MYEYLDRRYALALYKIGEEKGRVEEYIQDLNDIVDIIKNNNELLQLIKHPEVSTLRKKHIFTDIFKDKIDKELLRFLLILIEKDRILYLEEKLREMEKIHLEKKNTLMAKVKTVIPLEESEKEQLVKALEKKYNKKIILTEEVDTTIIGGVYVRVGNDVIDGTIKSRIEEMKKLAFSKE